MDEKGEDRNGGKKVIAAATACDVEALKKCLEQHKGNYQKCQSQVDAFKSSCSIKKPASNSTQT